MLHEITTDCLSLADSIVESRNPRDKSKMGIYLLFILPGVALHCWLNGWCTPHLNETAKWLRE